MKFFDNGIDLLFSAMVCILCSLAHCCVVVDDADLNVGDSFSGFWLSEAQGGASLFNFSDPRELAAPDEKTVPELSQTISVSERYCRDKNSFSLKKTSLPDRSFVRSVHVGNCLKFSLQKRMKTWRLSFEMKLPCKIL